MVPSDKKGRSTVKNQKKVLKPLKLEQLKEVIGGGGPSHQPR